MKKILSIVALTILTAQLQAVSLSDVLKSGNYLISGDTLDASNRSIDDLYDWKALQGILGIWYIDLGNNNIKDLPYDFMLYVREKQLIVYRVNNDFEQWSRQGVSH